MLQPHVFADHETVSQYAADWLINRLRARPAMLLCLATGATPMRTYALLAEHAANLPSLVEQCRILKLDEWGGLSMSDPATCEQHLRAALITPLGLSERYTAFDSQPRDPQLECARVAQWLQENGPIDTCVLGLGANGHLGFNEPAACLQPHAHVAQLSESSLAHAMLGEGGARPTYGLTLGMADILQSRHVLLLVTGAAKRGPVEQLLAGRITTQFPATLLHAHPRAQLLCDAAACLGDERGRP
jgi:galactosamine-6-phosphate isomerase